MVVNIILSFLSHLGKHICRARRTELAIMSENSIVTCRKTTRAYYTVFTVYIFLFKCISFIYTGWRLLFEIIFGNAIKGNKQYRLKYVAGIIASDLIIPEQTIRVIKTCVPQTHANVIMSYNWRQCKFLELWALIKLPC